ncbi:EB module [Cooperia oncophora]
MPTVAIGSPCSYTQQCLGDSTCNGGYCQCPGGGSAFYGKCSNPSCGQNQVYVNNQCYPMVVVGGSCMNNEQCTGYSQCTGGYCRCPNGAMATNGMCDRGSTACKSYQARDFLWNNP